MAGNYFQNIAAGIRTTVRGMRLTFRHLWAARRRRMPGDVRQDDFFGQSEGIVTIQYPLETIPIPDNGRYRLHNEMDDCIVCDKCAKICPVDCIDIEPIRATEEVGKASDGSPIRLYAARFDIDMAKCCYCGLCTTVCPTECLTMTKTFDYSELDVRDMVYAFGNLTPAEAAEKQRLLALFQAEKEALKATAQVAAPPAAEAENPPRTARPVFRPTAKKSPAEVAAAAEPTAEEPKETTEAPQADTVKPKVAPFRPTMKRPTVAQPAPAPEAAPTEDSGQAPEAEQAPRAKPKAAPFRPTRKPPPES